MSKNYGNYPDPKLMLQKYGGDALRLYLMGSSIMQGEDMNISEVIYRDQIKVFLLPLWNVYKYFTMYANVDGWKPSQKLDLTKEKLSFLDQWALSLTHSLVKDVTTALDAYDTMTAVTKLVKFIDDISKWYIRRSRDRVGPTVENIKDKELFYSTTYEVLHTFLKVAAPIAPFITELLYQNLTEEESVHLTNWPELNEKFIHKDLEQAMDLARKAAEEGHAKRKVDNIKVKIPIGNLMWTSTNDYSLINNTFPEIWEIVLKELNAKNITINSNITYPNPPIPFTEEELKKEGELRELIREIQAERKKLNCQVTDKVNITVPEQFGNDVAYIKSKVLAETVKTGEKLEVSAI
jgi:isoleucyl-tRNA synthetase